MESFLSHSQPGAHQSYYSRHSLVAVQVKVCINYQACNRITQKDAHHYRASINQILVPFIDQFMVTCLDDILIFSKSHSEYEKHVKHILKVLDEVG